MMHGRGRGRKRRRMQVIWAELVEKWGIQAHPPIGSSVVHRSVERESERETSEGDEEGGWGIYRQLKGWPQLNIPRFEKTEAFFTLG